jgi:RNA polymerase-binding transcription factor DksA
MSGYAGPDDDALHALILAENAIRASQTMIAGPVLEDCLDCGEAINPLRITAMQKIGMRCIRCILCQEIDDKRPKAHIKMLDRIL